MKSDKSVFVQRNDDGTDEIIMNNPSVQTKLGRVSMNFPNDGSSSAADLGLMIATFAGCWFGQDVETLNAGLDRMIEVTARSKGAPHE